MTLLNFPPTNGQPTDGSFTYTANGVIYAWDGEKWTANSEQGLDGNYVNIDGDTMTGDLQVPNLISEGDVQTTSLNGGPLAGLRNQIINGDFRVWQRGTSFTNASQAYTADRWISSPGTTTQAQAGTWSALRINGAQTYAYQPIELNLVGANVVDDRFSVGTTWTLSYYCDHPPDATISRLLQFSTGTSGSATNLVDAVTGGIPLPTATGQIKNGKTQYSSTFTIQNAPNTANNCLHVYVASNLTGADVDFCDVQLEPGPVATPFEHRPIGMEFSLCQRYYIASQFAIQGNAINGGIVANWIQFPTLMRTTPDAVISQMTKFPAGIQDPVVSTTHNNGIRIGVTNNTGANQANIAIGSAYTADAEL